MSTEYHAEIYFGEIFATEQREQKARYLAFYRELIRGMADGGRQPCLYSPLLKKRIALHPLLPFPK